MLNEKLIVLEQLEEYVQDAEPKAPQFDIEPRDLQEHLAAIRELAQRQ